MAPRVRRTKRMPENNSDTSPLPPVQMPPGFEELPAEEKLFIYGNKDKPEMMAVYQATKTLQLHKKFDKQCIKCEGRLDSLETSRSRVKWWGGGALAVLALFKAYIIGKLVKIFP